MQGAKYFHIKPIFSFWRVSGTIKGWNQSVNHAYLYGNGYWLADAPEPHRFTPLETFLTRSDSEENKNGLNKRCECAIKPMLPSQGAAETRFQKQNKAKNMGNEDERSWKEYKVRACEHQLLHVTLLAESDPETSSFTTVQALTDRLPNNDLFISMTEPFTFLIEATPHLKRSPRASTCLALLNPLNLTARRI